MGIRHKLRTKIIASSFVPTALILGAVAVLLLASYRQVIEDLVIERDRELTRLQAEILSDDLAEYGRLLSTIGHLIIASDDLDPGQQLADLDQLSPGLPFDGGLVLLNADGWLLASEPSREMPLATSWLARDYVAQCRQTLQPTYSNLVVDGPAGAQVIAVTVPLVGLDGQLQAMLCGMFCADGTTVSMFYSRMVRHIGDHTNPPEGATNSDDEQTSGAGSVPLDSFYRLLHRPSTLDLPLSTHSRSYIIDGSGRLVYHRELSQIGNRLSTQKPVQGLLSGASDSIRTRDLNGQEIVASYAPIPGTPWGLVTEELWDALIAPSQRYSRFLFALLACGLILPALLVTYSVRRITRPIEQVAAAAGEIAAGCFGQTIRTDSHDEIANLVEQFNTMSRELGSLYGQLEHRVAERTQTLQEMNRLAIETSRSLDADRVLATALERIVRLTAASDGAAYVRDDENNLQLQSQRDPQSDWPDHLAPTASRSLCQLSDAGASWFNRLVFLPGQDKGSNRLLLPLVAQDQEIGLLVLRGAPQPDPELADALATMARQVGLAIENARLYAQSRQVAILSERQRLARDLHDSVTQSLYGATLYASAANRLLAQGHAEQAQSILSDLESTTNGILKEMRLLIFELRPSVLREQGIVAALRTRLEAVEGRASIATSLSVHGKPQLSPAQEDALYGIAQEALNNALRHAQASHIDVCLSEASEGACLDIRDDGQGFGACENGIGLGLRGMRERAAEIGAKLSISSAPGNGTRIHVEVAA